MPRRLAGYVLVLAVGLLLLASCGHRPGQIVGQVTDASNGQALAQMRIVVYGLIKAKGVTHMDAYLKGDVLQEQVTDEEGRYSFSLEPGAYLVQVWANDQMVDDHLVKLQAGRVERVDFQVRLPSP